MSTHLHKTKPKHDSAHGSTSSYVVGFIISLIFTIVPYYLVVNEVLAGNTLVVVILAIAVWQMLIQLLFFLHLGRGPKPLYNVVFFGATAGIIVITIGASLFIMDNLYRNMTPEEVILRQSQEENIAQIGGRETGACIEPRESHIVTVSYDGLEPATVIAKRCDTLTFVNETSVDHEFAFGEHPYDLSYGGIDIVKLGTNGPEVITLNEVVDYPIHDHLDPDLRGFLVVTR